MPSMIDIIYDIEIFPNFWCITFLNTQTQESKTYSISWQMGIDESQMLREYLQQENIRLVGYNNLYFDYRILVFTLDYDGREDFNNACFQYSSNIIAGRKNSTDNGHPTARSRINFRIPQLDLMKLMAFDKLGISLKQIAVNLNWHKIQDLPLPYDHFVNPEEIKLIHDYNKNDVLISYKLYNNLRSQIELREGLNTLYNVDLTNASESKIANVLLEKFYAELGVNVEHFKYNRTKREFFWLQECIGKNISFYTKKMQEMFKSIANTLVVAENNFVYKRKLSFGNCVYDLGIGGLHSEDKPGIFRSDEKYIIRDADVTSYYPNIIILNKLIPQHLDENFITILKNITKERTDAKKSGDKLKADALKITINSIFGKLGSDTFWLEDSKAFISVTLSGHLYLLMLIERLTLCGITVISANTDGIVCMIPRHLENEYYTVCKEWESKTSFALEFTDYVLYIRSDVNNYVTKKADGKTKEKGRYLKDIDLKKGYKYPIVPEALYEYFVNDIAVEETVKNCTEIFKFCISQKCGTGFKMFLRKDGRDTPLQKTNRFYISSNYGGKLVKINEEDKREIGLYTEENVIILNDYKPESQEFLFSEYDVDYDFYIEEANKYIENILKDTTIWDHVAEEISEDIISADKILAKPDAKIVPSRFENSASGYVYDMENNVIYRGLSKIKFITASAAEKISQLGKNRSKYKYFVQLLADIENKSVINSKQLEILICLNYFSSFGNNKKLLNIYESFKTGKYRYTKSLKEESKAGRLAMLITTEENIPDERMIVTEQLAAELAYTGEIQSIYPSLDKRYVYVTDLNLKFSPKITIYCLANGKKNILKLNKPNYQKTNFAIGNILYCKKFQVKDGVIFKDGEFIKTTEKVWWLLDYNLINPNSLTI